jgi:hypothetical protein
LSAKRSDRHTLDSHEVFIFESGANEVMEFIKATTEGTEIRTVLDDESVSDDSGFLSSHSEVIDIETIMDYDGVIPDDYGVVTDEQSGNVVTFEEFCSSPSRFDDGPATNPEGDHPALWDEFLRSGVNEAQVMAYDEWAQARDSLESLGEITPHRQSMDDVDFALWLHEYAS